MKITKQLTTFVASVLLAANAFAMDQLEQGLKVGQTIPAELTATTKSGKEVSLADVSGEKGIIILFNRSLDWCGYCKAQVRDWNPHAETFKQKGYQVAALTYDTPKKLQAYAANAGVTYPLLSDGGSTIIKAFDLLNAEFEQGSRFHGIPHPAIYVIDTKGTVTHRFSIKGYKERPSVDVVHQALFGSVLKQ